MNLLEALKQIAEHTDKDERQYFMPDRDLGQKGGQFPAGYFGDRFPSGSPSPDTLLTEMWRQTVAAQKGIGNHGKDIRLNPDAVARFLKEQPPSENIDDRRNQQMPDNEPLLDWSILNAPPLRHDPFDPLAQLLGINSIGPRAMTVPENIPLPRPRR